jgi:hypothetical protein
MSSRNTSDGVYRRLPQERIIALTQYTQYTAGMREEEAKHMKTRVLIVFAAACLLLDGCGEFAYKRGSGQDSLRSSQQQCRSKAGNQADYEKCMQDGGWFVQRLDDFGKLLEADPIATIAPNQDNRDANSSIPVSQKNAEKPQATKDPLDMFIINSWWKVGGSPEALQIAFSDCVARLGEEHAPQDNLHKATRGLLLCMREKRWYGLQGR